MLALPRKPVLGTAKLVVIGDSSVLQVHGGAGFCGDSQRVHPGSCRTLREDADQRRAQRVVDCVVRDSECATDRTDPERGPRYGASSNRLGRISCSSRRGLQLGKHSMMFGRLERLVLGREGNVDHSRAGLGEVEVDGLFG